MTIAQEVITLRAQLPDTEPMRIFERGRLALARSTRPAIAVGGAMADAELLDAHGAPTTLTAAIGADRPAVVVFYRGTWCPYCNLTLRVYESELEPELRRRGVALVAVSPQKPDGSLMVTEKNALSFPVLSDPGDVLARDLGILWQAPEEILAVQRGLGVDLAERNGDGSTALPMPTVVLLDAAGAIRWADVRPDYTSRTEPAEVLAALDAHLS